MKEYDDKACNLDLPPGLHGIDYPQKFVKAPMSLHPKKAVEKGCNYESDKAMRYTLGK